ncbi:DinB family protein [Pseudonocardia sp. CA-107938]|uniref:DinB family protein n=1 Tax=Pseudonocardia sp. CA-107938 TaxID=3240021 RepID=UPI003D903292
MTDPVTHLVRYLQRSRDAVLRGLDGLSEYDARRPVVPSGNNVLGLVKHLATMELDYLGSCVGRPAEPPVPWVADGSVDQSADTWASPEESRAEIVALYKRAWAHSDASVAALPADAPAHVEWWPPERQHTTLGHLLVHLVDETARHAGHVDILRELVDGRTDNPGFEGAEQQAYVARVVAAAEPFR